MTEAAAGRHVFKVGTIDMHVIWPGRAGGQAYCWPAGSAGRAIEWFTGAGCEPEGREVAEAMVGAEMPSTPSPAAAATATACRVSNTVRTVPPLLTIDIAIRKPVARYIRGD
jgi:hypothetical protein